MTRAVDRVASALRSDILAGRYRPGARLGEAELASTLGASRTPVREALRQLDMEGIVEILPNRGARVATWTADELDEIYDLRALLEGFAARRAATRTRRGDLDRMDDLCDRMEAALTVSDLTLLAELNTEFHEIVRAASGSAKLAAMLAAVVRNPLVLRTFRHYTARDLERSAAHHRDLVAALRARDGDWAASVMQAHVRAAKSVLLAAVPAHGEE